MNVHLEGDTQIFYASCCFVEIHPLLGKLSLMTLPQHCSPFSSSPRRFPSGSFCSPEVRWAELAVQFSSVQFSLSVVSDSLQAHRASLSITNSWSLLTYQMFRDNKRELTYRDKLPAGCDCLSPHLWSFLRTDSSLTPSFIQLAESILPHSTSQRPSPNNLALNSQS